MKTIFVSLASLGCSSSVMPCGSFVALSPAWMGNERELNTSSVNIARRRGWGCIGFAPQKWLLLTATTKPMDFQEREIKAHAQKHIDHERQQDQQEWPCPA